MQEPDINKSLAIEAYETISQASSKIRTMSELIAAAANDGADNPEAFEWASVIVGGFVDEIEAANRVIYSITIRICGGDDASA